MNDSEINIAIAKLCGWSLETGASNPPMFRVHSATSTGPWQHSEAAAFTVAIPNYTTDLNAMHEAEKTLNEVQSDDYIRHLQRVLETPPKGSRSFVHVVIDRVHASAPQRAEAFLRTHN